VATFDYNPITGQLDLVGGGASYIDGVVADSSLLPVTLGTPALDAVYLAKAGSGVWLINRKPAGLYVRVANNGVAADWTYLGAFPEVNSSANWSLYDGTTPSKELKFDLSGISASTVRTLTVPNASGTIARTETFAAPPAIGSTTPSTGAFTTLTATPSSGSALTLTGGTVTASAPLIDATQTWNASGTTFTGLRVNVTNTNSATTSAFASFEISGVQQAFIRRDGRIVGANVYGGGVGLESSLLPQGVAVGSAAYIGFCSNSFANDSGGDLRLFRDAANVLAQRNAANAQTFRIYNTFTSATNFERLNIIAQSAGSVIIGTEKGSAGGTARALEFQTDGTTRLHVGTTGNVGIGTTSPSSKLAVSGSDGNEVRAAVTNTNASGSADIFFFNAGGSFFGSQIFGASASGSFGGISNSNLAKFVTNASNFVIGTQQAAPIILMTDVTGSGGERMRITSGGLVTFGGTTNLFPALKRSSTALQVRLADDSAFAPFECAGLTLNGDLTASTRNIVTDTTTGTKIGTATTQKLGFFNATPVVQQAAVADATDAASTQARLNDLLARLRTLGLIAT
jgi:hypothetical protein